ncbi:MAG: damage-inducible protein DinB [Chitinophagaceae bacterium]|jgi:uncharacterized damage-inducible protein DinB|nr:damage-inducible protein DinB [Chitinophagaceae bacterium]
METSTETGITITPQQWLKHWQGHRALTRRVIEAFPDDKLFSFSVGGMRPFGEMAIEMLIMATPTVKGVATGVWEDANKLFGPGEHPKDKKSLLAEWDKTTAQLNELWPTIPPHRFQEEDVAFGQWKDRTSGTILYVIDNEIHHRGQGYVYLRALGIEPPHFWER